jgi:hypothetical protein
VKLISFVAFVPLTVAEIAPLHCSVRLSSLIDVVTIFSPSVYRGFSVSGFDLIASFAAAFGLPAAYSPSRLL